MLKVVCPMMITTRKVFCSPYSSHSSWIVFTLQCLHSGSFDRLDELLVSPRIRNPSELIAAPQPYLGLRVDGFRWSLRVLCLSGQINLPLPRRWRALAASPSVSAVLQVFLQQCAHGPFLSGDQLRARLAVVFVIWLWIVPSIGFVHLLNSETSRCFPCSLAGKTTSAACWCGCCKTAPTPSPPCLRALLVPVASVDLLLPRSTVY